MIINSALEEVGSILKQRGVEGLSSALKEKRDETLKEMCRLQITAESIENRIGRLDSLKILNERLAEERILIELKVLSERMLRVGGLFIPAARGTIEMFYQFEKDFVVSSQKFTNLFGRQATTLEESLAATVEWYRAQNSYSKR